MGMVVRVLHGLKQLKIKNPRISSLKKIKTQSSKHSTLNNVAIK